MADEDFKDAELRQILERLAAVDHELEGIHSGRDEQLERAQLELAELKQRYDQDIERLNQEAEDGVRIVEEHKQRNEALLRCTGWNGLEPELQLGCRAILELEQKIQQEQQDLSQREARITESEDAVHEREIALRWQGIVVKTKAQSE